MGKSKLSRDLQNLRQQLKTKKTRGKCPRDLNANELDALRERISSMEGPVQKKVIFNLRGLHSSGEALRQRLPSIGEDEAFSPAEKKEEDIDTHGDQDQHDGQIDQTSSSNSAPANGLHESESVMEIYTSSTEIQIVKKITSRGFTHTPTDQLVKKLFPIAKRRKITQKEVNMLSSNGWDRERMLSSFIIPAEQDAPPKRSKKAIQDGMRGLQARCKDCRKCLAFDYNIGGSMCDAHEEERSALNQEMSTLEA